MKEVGFGSILIPRKGVEKDELHVVIKPMGKKSLTTMRLYTTGDGRMALNALAETTGRNKRYIKAVLPKTMKLNELEAAYRVYCEDEGMPLNQDGLEMLKRYAEQHETVMIDI